MKKDKVIVTIELEENKYLKDDIDVKNVLSPALAKLSAISSFEIKDIQLPESFSNTGNYKKDVIRFHSKNYFIDEDKYLCFKSSDIYIELLEKNGKYAVNDNGNPKFGMWFDNIGIFTDKLHPCYGSICIGIYGRKDNKYVMMYHKNDDGRKLMYCNSSNWDLFSPDARIPKHKDIVEYLDSVTEFYWCTPLYNMYFNKDKNSTIFQESRGDNLNWIKDESISLDENTKLASSFHVGWDRQHYDLYVDGKRVDYFYSATKEYIIQADGNPDFLHTDRFVDDFIKKFRYAKENDPELLKKLKEGVGYTF